MAAATQAQQLGDAVVAFALESRFPEDISQLPLVSGTDLEPAIQALAKAKTELEGDIYKINEETKGDVSSWIKNAKELQEDIIRSKTIANDIVRQSESPHISGQAIQDAEDKTDFLNREVQYSLQLHGVLRGIQHVNQLLGRVEQAVREQRILDSLHLLEESWSAIDRVDVAKSCRAMKILDIRSFELKSDIHEVFNQVWKDLVYVDIEARTVTLRGESPGGQMSLADAVVGLKAYKELDERMEQFWHNLDATIVAPRMSLSQTDRPSIRAEGESLKLDGTAGSSVVDLLSDLDSMFVLVASRLPPDLLRSLCAFMMPDIIPRLIQDWLTPAVPSSLQNMDEFQGVIQKAEALCSSLQRCDYTGFDKLSDWVGNTPQIWLGKCRETVLNSVRTKLTNGVGKSRQVEKVEKHMVSLSEGKELATAGAGAAADTNDWGDAWGEEWDDEAEGDDGAATKPEAVQASEPAEGEDDGADAWGWDGDNDEAGKPAAEQESPEPAQEDEEMDDSADAWGWGDEDAGQETKPKSPTVQKKRAADHEQTRELVLKETYNISSMPDPVLELVFAILEDGATLTGEASGHELVAATAPGLFTLPTFALALFRAISPHYYSLDVGGNMFLYNDAMYLSEKLSDFSSQWKQRDDLTPRAKAMLRLDNDIKSLQHFANRSYAAEMNIQKTVLRDLLGGSQSLMQQDDAEASVESGMARIRAMAATWETILARSVWSQAIGALAEALATKLITDVLEMSSIGQEEAYSIASLIATATQLDDLFLPSKLAGENSATAAAAAAADGDEDAAAEVPATAQYAPSWLRLKFLSEVLQSNLNEVKFLWCDSELSLYFTVDEVVDLIRASFEANARTRETIKEVQARPQPLAG